MRKYQYYNTDDDADRDIYGVNWSGQTFTPETGHMIANVRVKLFRVGDPSTITVSIKATSGGKPVGADLCSGIIEGNTITDDAGGDWYEISMGNGCEVTAGVQYAIVIQASAGDVGNKLSWRTDASAPTYTGGLYCGSSDSGTDWNTYSGSDAMFEEWGAGPPSPTTVVWGALAKSQISLEKIEEAITRMIQDHEDDPDAHIEVGESLQSHKASAIIDHIADSIITDKIKDGEISGIKIGVSGKFFECIVAASDGDYTSIQDALDDGKKRIYVKAGVYTISSTILIESSDVVIEGEGWNSTQILLDPLISANTDLFQFGDGMTEYKNLILRKLHINGNKDNVGAFTSWGIFLTANTGRVQISDCQIEQCKTGAIKITYSGAHNIFNNRIGNQDGATSYGIWLDNTYGNRIINNLFWSNYYSIYIESWQAAENIITGNEFQTSYRAIHIDSARRTIITSNRFYRHTDNVIHLHKARGTIISNNAGELNDKNVFYLWGATYTKISNNALYGNCIGADATYTEIMLSGDVTDGYSLHNIVDGNTILETAANRALYGIRENSANDNKNTITSNTVIGPDNLISLQGADTEIGHNITA